MRYLYLSLLSALLLFSVQSSFSQEVKKENKSLETKIEVFTSKTGRITKFIDFNLPLLKTSYDNCDTRIRKLSSGTEALYFYQIVKTGKYSNTTASIEYSDLLEILKAFATLKADVDKDLAKKPDYLENKFISNDGFQLGYYIKSDKITWYLKLDKYGSDNTLFTGDVNVIETAFNEAKIKLEELKK